MQASKTLVTVGGRTKFPTALEQPPTDQIGGVGVEPERRDREWEHWPGRGTPDGTVRGRLRGLFSPTDAAELEIEELIEARSRDLELRTAELTSTIGDLQRREDETRELRASIESILREGAEELDQRHAQLTALSSETLRRETELEEIERALEERRQELGAVELRRAAVERRETGLATKQSELDRIRDELAARVADAEERAAELERRRVDAEQRSAELTALASSSRRADQGTRDARARRRQRAVRRVGSPSGCSGCGVPPRPPGRRTTGSRRPADDRRCRLPRDARRQVAASRRPSWLRVPRSCPVARALTASRRASRAARPARQRHSRHGQG